MQVNQINPNVLTHWMSYVFPNPIMDWLLSFLRPISDFLGIPYDFSISIFYIILCSIVSLIVYASLGSFLVSQILLMILIVIGFSLGLISLSIWWILVFFVVMLYFIYWHGSADINDIEKDHSVMEIKIETVEEKAIVEKEEKTVSSVVDKERVIEKRGALTIRK